MSVVTVTFSFESSAAMMSILGIHDKFIKIMENYFNDAKFLVRGHDLVVTAAQSDLEKITGIIKDMQTLVNKGGEINEHALEQFFQEMQQLHFSVESSRQEIVEALSTPIVNSRGVKVVAKTKGQKQYVDAIDSKDIVFGIGPAGTGKTYLAVAKAVQALKTREVERIILTRPAVEAGERLGFLPGGLSEKIDPYLRPLYDALHDMMDPLSISRFLESGAIEVAPLAYMRGRTLNNAFVILDEAQNTTKEQMKMFLTRLGFGSKMVITGDSTQIDLPRRMDSGLDIAQQVLNGVDGIAFYHLDSSDVVRHRVVSRIVDAYSAWEVSL